jgi:two-component system, cell cycle sensor histidine kinase and response regulator CckA
MGGPRLPASGPVDTLREVQARYRTLLEHSSDIVLEIQLDGRIVHANPTLCAMLAMDRASLARTTFLELVHDEDRAHVAELLEQPSAAFAFRLRSADASYHRLEAKAVRFRQDDGREHHVLICRDGTERLQAERALRESAALFSTTFRVSPISNSITTLETGRILEINRAFESYFGYSREEVLGRTTVELGLWANSTDRGAYVRELEQHGSIRGFEASLRNRSGRVGSFLMSAERVDIGGEPYLLNIIEDVTERRAAERALRESEEKFHKAFQTGPHPLSIVDFATGELIEVNVAYERATGFSREQLIGHTPVELGIVSVSLRQRAFDAWSSNGPRRDVEIEFRNSSGEQRTAVASSEFLELGGRRCMIVGVHDVTDQRRMEAAKAQLEEELRQIQKLEAIGTLAGGIAHDFNNILGAMLGYTEVAKLDAAAMPGVLESLTEVQASGERAKELVRQILTFSSRHPVERRPIRLEPIVAEVQRLLRATLPATIELSTRTQPETDRVRADPTQIHQIVLNLATNAAHALGGKPGRIEIRLGRHGAGKAEPEARPIPNLRPGDFVELIVKDSGCGMTAETLLHIFEPFFTTKKAGEGTGLGLSVVHGIVREHDGVVHVASEPGIGSSFHILLPVFAESAPTDEAAAPASLVFGSMERILFIDDEPMLCSAAQKLLGKLNYVVTTQTNAAEAVQLFRADPSSFDLVITDLTMPGMTGVDVAAQVLLSRPGLPVLLATGFNASWTLDAVRALGIHDLIMKPLSTATLSEKIRAALQRA